MGWLDWYDILHQCFCEITCKGYTKWNEGASYRSEDSLTVGIHYVTLFETFRVTNVICRGLLSRLDFSEDSQSFNASGPLASCDGGCRSELRIDPNMAKKSIVVGEDDQAFAARSRNFSIRSTMRLSQLRIVQASERSSGTRLLMRPSWTTHCPTEPHWICCRN